MYTDMIQAKQDQYMKWFREAQAFMHERKNARLDREVAEWLALEPATTTESIPTTQPTPTTQT
jgi:hypothetical protein